MQRRTCSEGKQAFLRGSLFSQKKKKKNSAATPIEGPTWWNGVRGALSRKLLSFSPQTWARRRMFCSRNLVFQQPRQVPRVCRGLRRGPPQGGARQGDQVRQEGVPQRRVRGQDPHLGHPLRPGAGVCVVVSENGIYVDPLLVGMLNGNKMSQHGKWGSLKNGLGLFECCLPFGVPVNSKQKQVHPF